MTVSSAALFLIVKRSQADYGGLALIGSANINERSQMGDRDSELLSVIRDTDMIDG